MFQRVKTCKSKIIEMECAECGKFIPWDSTTLDAVLKIWGCVT